MKLCEQRVPCSLKGWLRDLVKKKKLQDGTP